MRIDVEASLVQRYVLDLARHGAYGETGVWRTAYSPEWVAAQEQVASWYAEAGLDVRRDAVGNVWGTISASALQRRSIFVAMLRELNLVVLKPRPPARERPLQ